MTQFIPKEELHGGSRVGNSYCSTFANCPKKWFNNFLRPVETIDPKTEKPVLTQGIRPRQTAQALLAGSIFHEGLASWYLSGCRDGEDTGEYSLEAAIEGAKLHWSQRKHEYEGDVDPEEDWLTNQAMLVAYAEHYGPDSPGADWPDLRVAHDGEGKPLIEREFTSKLGYNDYIYTMRADLVVHHRGFLKMGEHKSSVASFVKNRLQTSHWDSQMTGQCWVMATEFPDTLLNGVWLNVVVKNRSVRSKFDVAERDTTTRTQFQLANFRVNVIDILERIDDAVGFFWEDYLGGKPLEEAAQKWFPDHGTRTGTCLAYNRECEYASLCKGAGREEQLLVNFKPRSTVEISEMKEWTG